MWLSVEPAGTSSKDSSDRRCALVVLSAVHDIYTMDLSGSGITAALEHDSVHHDNAADSSEAGLYQRCSVTYGHNDLPLVRTVHEFSCH